MPNPPDVSALVDALLTRTEQRRRHSSSALGAERRRRLGQFFTPRPVAERVAAEPRLPSAAAVTVLDPGAGIGSLTAAFVGRLLAAGRTARISLTAAEIDDSLHADLADTLADCCRTAAELGVEVSAELLAADFVQWGAQRIAAAAPGFDIVIQNPPYGKISRTSAVRRQVAGLGIEVPNIYAAFLAVGAHLLAPRGQLVAITPRSFANGTYFRDFRRDFLATVGLDRLCVFHERGSLFADSAVLQENIIVSATRGSAPATVVVATSRGYADHVAERTVRYDQIIRSGDRELFVTIPTDVDDDRAAATVAALPATLSDLGLQVSTGRVIEFRSREDLRARPGAGTVPLIHPSHLRAGRVHWPAETRKPNALAVSEASQRLMLPRGAYVLVKRFTSKEQPRRIAAFAFRLEDTDCDRVGFENHLNVFHASNEGIDPQLAAGLAVWLNSSVVDLCFRQFSGHTQVNATDLRTMRYPSREQLLTLGEIRVEPWPTQDEIDGQVAAVIHQRATPEPPDASITAARAALRALNFDAERSDERSALVLLALLNLLPGQDWREAANPRLRTVDITDFLRKHYRRDCKPSTLAAIRRSTLHQFIEAALVLVNPDAPQRPADSARTCYQIDEHALDLLRRQR